MLTVTSGITILIDLASHGAVRLPVSFLFVLVMGCFLCTALYREELILDLRRGIWQLNCGPVTRLRVTRGSIEDIAAIHLAGEPGADIFSIWLVWSQDSRKRPVQIDTLPCSVRLPDFTSRVRLCLELAALLHIPVYDDSGWHPAGSRDTAPQRIIVAPGKRTRRFYPEAEKTMP